MPKFLIHHKGAYNFYTTVADGACFVSALTLDQVKEYTKEEFGNQGMMNLPGRLERCHRKGVSSCDNQTLRELLLCNRSGPRLKKAIP